MLNIAIFFMRLSDYLNELARRIKNGDKRALVEGWLFAITLVTTAIYILRGIVWIFTSHL